jgi:porin
MRGAVVPEQEHLVALKARDSRAVRRSGRRTCLVLWVLWGWATASATGQPPGGGSPPPAAETPPATQPVEASATQPAEVSTTQPSDRPEGPRNLLEVLFPESKYAPLALDSPWMTGDWFGLRTGLENVGLSTQVYFNNTSQWNVKGGRFTSGANHNGATIDWFVTADFEKMGLIPGGLLLGHFRRQWGRGINRYTGAIWEVADDLDGDYTLHVDQLWYEQSFLERKLRFKLGYLDYQTIVDRNACANSEDKQFLNLALDNNPLVPLNIGLGAALTVQPVEWLSLIAGVSDAGGRLGRTGFDTAFHDSARFLSYFEAGLHPKLPAPGGGQPLPGNYRLGLIYDPRPRAIFEDPRVQPPRRLLSGEEWGFYGSFDQMLWRENGQDAQGLSVFARYGLRQGETNRIANFWSAGVQYEGLIPTRDSDVLGFGVAQGVSSGPYRDFIDPSAGSETVYELYYSIQITRWLAVTPDFQYVSHPGAGDEPHEAVVLGLRVRVSF